MQIIPVEKLGFAGKSMLFGTLQQVFQAMYDGRGIVLGYMVGPDLKLAVPQHTKMTWHYGDRLVTIIRRKVGDDDDEENGGNAQPSTYNPTKRTSKISSDFEESMMVSPIKRVSKIPSDSSNYDESVQSPAYNPTERTSKLPSDPSMDSSNYDDTYTGSGESM